MPTTILGIESSCDETSVAVIRDQYELSNVTAGQHVHKNYGGVVPELASRAHQQNIIPVVEEGLKKAGVTAGEIDAVAFTRGPGLLGSLLVGTSFAKGFSIARGIPLIEINHLQGHVLAHFIKEPGKSYRPPEFPFLSLLVSGGHSQIILVRDFFDLEVIGNTIDDAAGEAFDKSAKTMGLPYPGGPLIDKMAQQGNPDRFKFNKPRIDGLNYSFSGLKTSFLYFLRDEVKNNPGFIRENQNDLAASLQKTIIDMVMEKLLKAAEQTGIREITVAGGVSANSGLRKAFHNLEEHGYRVYIPEFKYTTDNAAMIGIVGYFKYLKQEFTSLDVTPVARFGV